MKNKQKGFIVPLLLIILALVVVGGVYYQNKKNTETSNPAQPTEQQTSTSTTTTEDTPKITSVTGSASLSLNEEGSWTVAASDPNDSSLSYSVVWGEPGTYAEDNIRIKAGGIQVAKFVHTYTKAGVYPLVFKVINDNGKIDHSNVITVTVSSTTKTSTPAPVSTTIKLDAATKVAVVQAIMNGIDILSSNDVVKIRSYAEIQDPKDKAMYEGMSDSQLLQIAANGVGNEGKPTPDLATDSTAVWKVDGNTVSVTHKSYAAPNPDYPAISELNVTFKATYVNGEWH